MDNSSVKKNDKGNEKVAHDKRVRLPNAQNNAFTCNILGHDAAGMDHFSAVPSQDGLSCSLLGRPTVNQQHDNQR